MLRNAAKKNRIFFPRNFIFSGKIRTKNLIKPCIYQHLPAQMPHLTGSIQTLYSVSLVNVVYYDIFILSFNPPAAPKTHRTVQKPACNNGAGRQKPKAKNQPSGRSTETQHPPQPTYQLYFSEPLTVLERCDCTETAPTHFFTYQLSFSERVMAKETFGTDGWVDGVDFFGGRNLDFSQKNCIITIDLTTQVKPI